MKYKKGFIPLPLLIWLLGIYFLIGIIFYVWAGISSDWWSLQNLVLWPKTLIELRQLGQSCFM
jgi:hypothetical protein